MSKPRTANPALAISEADLASALAQIGTEVDDQPLRSSALARIMRETFHGSDAGGAWMMPDKDFTPMLLTGRLTSLFSMETTVPMAARCAAQIGMPEATERLADVIAGIIGANGNGGQSPVREAAA